MKKVNDYLLLLTTCPNSEEADKLAHALLENHLAACVNILPNIQSVYEWKGKIVHDKEVMLFIKTHQKHYAAVEKTLVELHPYEVPELIALSLETGLPSYLAWIDSVVAK